MTNMWPGCSCKPRDRGLESAASCFETSSWRKIKTRVHIHKRCGTSIFIQRCHFNKKFYLFKLALALQQQASTALAFGVFAEQCDFNITNPIFSNCHCQQQRQVRFSRLCKHLFTEISNSSGNTNWRERLSTVDHLIRVACFVKK